MSSKSEQRKLQQLIGLLKQTEPQKKVLDSSPAVSQTGQWPSVHRVKGQSLPPETSELQRFCLQYHAERNFSKHACHKKFLELFTLLIKLRLCNSAWMEESVPDSVLQLLMCLRIMLRDPVYQAHFFTLRAEDQLSGYMERATGTYLQFGETHCMVDILKEMTNIFQKLSSIVEQQQRVIACGAHRALVLLLTSGDVLLLHCALATLVCLAQCQRTCEQLVDMNCIEQLLIIVQGYDNVSKKQATRLLGQLCQDVRTATALKLHDGVPILLSQLVSDSASLLHQVVRCICSLCVDSEISKNVRQMGGIPLLLSILNDRTFISEQTETSGTGSAGLHQRTGVPDQDFSETQYKLKQACCNALCQLVLSDTNAQQIAEANGVYSLGQLILPPSEGAVSARERKAAAQLQRSAFRTLRFLFSMERNRRLFKKLFPAELYILFIDVGHYNWDMAAYKPLVQAINGLSPDQLKSVRDGVGELNQNRTPTHYIQDYAVFEHLGRGAFGSVYKVRKKVGQTFLALKEIDMKNPAFGKSSTERDKSMGEALSELQIMRQGIRHPNIVRYHKTFVQASTLFIIMDLIEGAPLNEHFNSLREKQSRFAETRIWHILLQMLQALRYLHKDKGIVHRDLTPNNIMLAEDDKVTITDFGLAKVKGTDTSKMTSQCGTILYSSPEMVEGAPYTEKVDVWALGCILYQMCVLDPPFYNTNMLKLVTDIVQGIYKPVPDGLYSDRLVNLIKRCICPRADLRPDTEQLAGSLSDVILRHMDAVQAAQVSLQNKLDRERRKTQKHFVESNQLMQGYHRLFASPYRPCNLGDSQGLGTSGCDSQQSSALNSPMENESVSWTSDDDSWQSSECDSLSRESSAGSSRGGSQRLHSHLPPVPTPHSLSQQLAVDIPQIAKVSRDSGFGSCDPSPVSPDARRYSRSYSTPGNSSGPKKKTLKAKEPQTLTISNRRVRQINDPITQLLHTLHKIVYISQLPPTLSPNPRRRVIERFKRALFAPGSSSLHLKGELHKLNIGSREVIDLNVGSLSERINSAGSDWSLGSGLNAGTSDTSLGCRSREGSGKLRSRSSSRPRVGSAGSGSSDSSLGSTIKDTPTPRSLSDTLGSTIKGTPTPRSLSDTLTTRDPPDSLIVDVTHLEQEDNVTYEQLQSMIETVLVECGYYSGGNESRNGSKKAMTPDVARARIQ
ncbi:serine/threonine-protein kinase Nek10-like isoform X2 [Dreissena polymorpha]|uniref:serine/threonine-protein kinase Nek10-like isoform X2 n=1 Tax=Dreissena polymorpha TaxID=45954 RepID=UPI002263C94B|nr:serine/threonine-protein kinase Nek10-like isoform X2 [Dreissena polymorpha]